MKDLDTRAPFPTCRVHEIVSKKVDWLINGLLAAKSITLITGQPGSFKTWLSLELGLSIASGTKALGQFDTAKIGSVLYFNAEDDPATVTKARLEALAKGKAIDQATLDNLPFLMLDIDQLKLDYEVHQANLEKTIEACRPTLVILDPFRNLHSQNEDKSTELMPLLNFIRGLNRRYQTAFLIVFHDRKPSDKSGHSRGAQIRGSNAVEGWRDSILFLDPSGDGRTRLQLYHRAVRPRPPFVFRLQTSEHDTGSLDSATLITEELHEEQEMEFRILEYVKKEPGITQTELRDRMHKNRANVFSTVKELLAKGILIKKGAGLHSKEISPFGLEPRGTESVPTL